MLRGLDFYITHFFRRTAPQNITGTGNTNSTSRVRPRRLTRSCSLAHISTAGIDTNGKKGGGLDDPEYAGRVGYFYLWKNKWFTNRTPTFHWGATTMFHALSHLLLTMR